MKWRLQSTHRNNGAGIRFLIETLHHPEIRLAGPHHAANADCFRRHRKRYATSTAHIRRDEPMFGKSVHNSYQVMF